jgi:zinc protease
MNSQATPPRDPGTTPSRASRLRAALPVLALMALASPVALPAQSSLPGADGIATQTLPNGLQVVVWPDHDIPNVAMYTWYRVGSRNERPGITGISHFFEHMMFNGTKTRPPGEFDRVMEANGGSNNAYTSSDVTVYQNWFPRSALELIFDLEADRMRNLDFEPKVVESERGVITSERRAAIDNDNFGLLIEQMQATAYVAHPYQIPTIGWPSDIEAWKVEDLQAYYRQYYAPNNAVMFVVGDVEPAEVFALAGKYLATLQAQPAPEPVRTREPTQLGERRLRIEHEAQTPLIAMAWHTSAAPDRASRVMEVVLSILGDGDSSRLHQRLVEREQAAVEIGTALDQGFDPGLAWFYAIVPPGGDPARVETLVDEELARLAREGPTPVELEKARNQALAGFWRGLETISGKAQALGEYQVFHGDYRKLFDAPAVYEGISAEDVKQAVATVLRATNRTVGTLMPAADSEAPAVAQAGAQ